MTDRYWIDRSHVRSSAPAFIDVGDRLKQVFDELHSAVESEGECWGSDDYGKSFTKEYLPSRDSAYEFLPEVAKAVRDIGAGLIETVDTIDRAESANDTKMS